MLEESSEATPVISQRLGLQNRSLKSTKHSLMAVAVISCSLFWFGMEWEVARPRQIREITINRTQQSSDMPPCEDRSSNHSNNNTRAMVGSWQANLWIPPDGWDYVSVRKMKQLYTNKTLLWLGDSLSRRAALTWHSLLTTLDPQDASLWSLDRPGVIDATKYETDFECTLHLKAKHRPKICRVNSTYPFLQIRENCWVHILRFLHDEKRKPDIFASHALKLIVVAAGTWDTDIKEVCRLDDFHPLSYLVEKVIVSLNHVASNHTRVVVRTTAYSDSGPERAAEVDEMNELIMDNIDRMKNPFLTYVHWGGAMKPRSLSPYRLGGDNKAHFGVEGRLVLIHMLTNHLLDVGFFDSGN